MAPLGPPSRECPMAEEPDTTRKTHPLNAPGCSLDLEQSDVNIPPMPEASDSMAHVRQGRRPDRSIHGQQASLEDGYSNYRPMNTWGRHSQPNNVWLGQAVGHNP